MKFDFYLCSVMVKPVNKVITSVKNERNCGLEEQLQAISKISSILTEILTSLKDTISIQL